MVLCVFDLHPYSWVEPLQWVWLVLNQAGWAQKKKVGSQGGQSEKENKHTYHCPKGGENAEKKKT